MYREIKKKKLILENRKPYRKEVSQFLDELNRVDWIYSSMRLDGNNLSRNSVERILKGEFLIDVSVKDHSYKAIIRM